MGERPICASPLNCEPSVRSAPRLRVYLLILPDLISARHVPKLHRDGQRDWIPDTCQLQLALQEQMEEAGERTPRLPDRAGL